MILKLAAFSQEHYDSLDAKDKSKYNAMKAGASLVGSGLGIKYLTSVKKDYAPSVGKVRRFLMDKNILIPGLKDTVTKRVFTPGKAVQMGAIGVLGGGLLGLGIHQAAHAIKKRKQ